MHTESQHKSQMMKLYQRFMEKPVMQAYYGNSNFNNVGLWEGDIRTQKEACIHLMRTLVSDIPTITGKILDVACGTGGTTAFLAEYFDATAVTGINISPDQIQICKINYPHLEFIEMDAVNLQFPDESFDIIFCVEAAFHFNTRADFIRESFRTLKKGGVLVIGDIVMNTAEQLHWFIPETNNERSIEDYRLLLEKNGFISNSIIDKTNATCLPYSMELKKWATEQLFYKNISPDDYRYILSLSELLIQYPINNYLLISSVKN